MFQLTLWPSHILSQQNKMEICQLLLFCDENIMCLDENPGFNNTYKSAVAWGTSRITELIVLKTV